MYSPSSLWHVKISEGDPLRLADGPMPERLSSMFMEPDQGGTGQMVRVRRSSDLQVFISHSTRAIRPL